MGRCRCGWSCAEPCDDSPRAIDEERARDTPVCTRARRARHGAAAAIGHRGSGNDRRRQHPHRRRLRIIARRCLSGFRFDGEPAAAADARRQLRLQLDPRAADRRRVLRPSAHYEDRARAAVGQARTHRRGHDGRRRCHRRDQDSRRLRGAGPPVVRDPARDEASGREQRERPRARHDGFFDGRPHRQDVPTRFGSSATSASASWRIRSRAIDRTTCCFTGCPSPAP